MYIIIFLYVKTTFGRNTFNFIFEPRVFLSTDFLYMEDAGFN